MAFWDALTGIGTIALAVATFVVVKQSVRLREDDERHHQEQFRPVCVFVRPNFSDPRSPGNQLIVVNPNVAINLNRGLLYIRSKISNIGAGPALNIRISLRIVDMGNLRLNRYELAPLAPGTSTSENPDFCIPILLTANFNQTDFLSLEGRQWELILEYEDVFGTVFHSIHRKPPMEPWVILGRGLVA